ncbi:hypothetical protein [Streptomyces sp. I05A-00742]|uniref:hypothetical protein n=1 Tax=Streptomyces sp. I05A-00742 TaxID=2732853 RepID=UPI0014891BFB|nr:hypothetical protein [Streptomyces sp. I05A-00742]
MDTAETHHAWRAALADGDPYRVEQLLRRDPRLVLFGYAWSGTGEAAERAELRGLLLPGGRGDVPFAADSPWGIPADADFADALEHVWAPVADNCPGFLAALRAEVLGLALIAMEDTYLLGYLYLTGRTGGLPRDLRDLPPYTGANALAVLWGTAPTRLGPTDVVPLLEEPLPAGVRDLAAVHSSITSFDVDFELCLDRFSTTLRASTLADHEGEDPDDYAETEDFTRALNGEFDRWVQFCTCGSACEAYFLDMADRDPHDIPRVTLANMDGTSERPGAPFWTWFDQSVPSLLFFV